MSTVTGAAACAVGTDPAEAAVLAAADLEVLAATVWAMNDGVTHEPFGNPAGPGLWHHKGKQLPAYIQQVAHGLRKSGMDESRAIATAVSRCKVWCAGGDNVKADTRAKACAAVAEWETLKGMTHAAWDPSKHPRAPAGGPGGGQFSPGSKQAAPTNQKPVGQGAKGAQVSELQKRLNELGANLKADGTFGPDTLAAVKEFQKTHKGPDGKPLKVDGLVGPLTTWALRGGHGAPPGSKPAKGRKPLRDRETKAAEGPQLITIPGVDLVAAGTWQLSSGRQTFTSTDLEHAIEAAQCPAVGNPVIKLGHVDTRFDGEPALGQVTNMRLDSSGTKLLGDLAGMPGWLAQISASAYPRRSVEGSYGMKCQIGHVHPFALTGLALLGVTAPGVGVLNSLGDIAALYGMAASAEASAPWRVTFEEGEPVVAISEEDVRRAWYASSAEPDWWITELQMAPTQLIVANGQGGVYRVPFEIQDEDHISFGPAEEMADYAAVAASRGTGPSVLYASAEDSRAGLEVDAAAVDNSAWDASRAWAAGSASDDPARFFAAICLGEKSGGDPSTQEHWALPYRYSPSSPPNAAALRAALAVLAGARGGVSGLANADAAKAKAASLMKQVNPGYKAAADGPPPQLEGDNVVLAADNAMMGHAACTGTHSHAHPAYGAQGGDATHGHSHTHAGDNSHAHAHAQAGAGNNREGGSDVEFTTEQEDRLRASLGLVQGEELDADMVVSAAVALKAKVDTRVTASRQLPPGVMTVDREAWEALNRRVEQGEQFRAAKLVEERDEVIAAAVRAGKFSAARVPLWQRQWDAAPTETRDIIASLQKNVVPVDDVGSPGSGDEFDGDAFEAEFAAMYPPGTPGFTRKRK